MSRATLVVSGVILFAPCARRFPSARPARRHHGRGEHRGTRYEPAMIESQRRNGHQDRRRAEDQRRRLHRRDRTRQRERVMITRPSTPSIQAPSKRPESSTRMSQKG